jgi:hypothetical protein
MSHKKQTDDPEVLPEQLSMSNNKDVSSPDSISVELTKFRNLLAQYKAKVFETHAHLFHS